MFFFTLPSCRSADAFDKKNIQTQLPEPIELKGEWEVGLAEIQYLRSWYTILCGKFVYIGDLRMDINEGYYH